MLRRIHSGLLFANFPVVLFAIVAAYGSIFAPGSWDIIRGTWLISPLLLIGLLVLSAHLFDDGRKRIAITLGAIPIAALIGLLFSFMKFATDL